jgi:N-acetyltransferase 10
MTSYDLKRLDMYSHNMVDHHLVTDLIPNLARLYFLGHLNDGVISLSMVQKALLLGVGLQHRSLDELSVELNLPVNQVLALFNKAVRKLNTHLKQLVESDVEKNMLASKDDARKIARKTEQMTRTSETLDEDMKAGASEVMDIIHNNDENNKSKQKKKGKNSSSTTSALLLEDSELMSYAIKGSDEQWNQITNNKTNLSSVSLKSDNNNINQYEAISAAASSSSSSSSNITKILNEVEEERLEKNNKGKKKKARILAGGFNETVDKKDKKNKTKKNTPIKKPDGKYKNM